MESAIPLQPFDLTLDFTEKWIPLFGSRYRS
jgi:hypothetical protein